MHRALSLSAIIMVMIFINGCVTLTKKIDPLSFISDPPVKELIPPVCEYSYKHAFPSVAVVNFTNNSTFDYAKSVQTSTQGTGQRSAVGGAAVGVVPGAAGLVWGTKEKSNFTRDSQRIEREINAKLSESVEDGIINEIVSIGGAKVFTRNEIKKIIEEQKFQSSGLVDNTQLVSLGKIAGVRYIITGSINNVNLSYKSFESAKSGLASLGIWGSIASTAAETQEGWNISTDIAIRILDVQTGEVLFSKMVSGREVIGKIPYPSYDALVGGIKKAAAEGLQDARPELSKWFTLKGYVFQTRTSPDGKERVALINIGSKQGLKEGDSLFVYTFQEVVDPFNPADKSCDIQKLPVELVVTNQLQTDKAWVFCKGKPECIKRIKVGQLVERAPLSGGGLLPKLF